MGRERELNTRNMNKFDGEIEPQASYDRKYKLKTEIDAKLRREIVQSNPGRP